MRKTRAHFKYALRFARQQEETARADALARDLVIYLIVIIIDPLLSQPLFQKYLSLFC